MKKFLFFLFMINAFTNNAQDLNSFFKNADDFLKSHVVDGKVDYKAIKKDSAQLDGLIDQAKDISVVSSDKSNYQAFWINTYNLIVIKGIVEQYPVKSPLDINGFFDKIKYDIGGKSVTLNDIENNMLRAKFSDARFHFVLVCAGLGCPPIIPGAYMPDTLDAQLTKQTKLAINNPNFIKVNTKKKRVGLSEIFKWYNEDFTGNGMSLIDFINQYKTQKVPANFKTSYYTYDWNLNNK